MVLMRRIHQCFRFQVMLDRPFSLPPSLPLSPSLSLCLSLSGWSTDGTFSQPVTSTRASTNGCTMAHNAGWIRNLCVCVCVRVCTCACACLAGKCTSVSIQAHLWHIPWPWSLCRAVAALWALFTDHGLFTMEPRTNPGEMRAQDVLSLVRACFN